MDDGEIKLPSRSIGQNWL